MRLASLFLVFQFALVAAIPCQCFSSQMLASSSDDGSARVQCCPNGCTFSSQSGSDGLQSDLDRRLPPGAEHKNIRACLESQQPTRCPGRLLPDLSEPPVQDNRVSILAPSPLGKLAIADGVRKDTNLISGSDAAQSDRSSPCAGDRTLLRLGCALIV